MDLQPFVISRLLFQSFSLFNSFSSYSFQTLIFPCSVTFCFPSFPKIQGIPIMSFLSFLLCLHSLNTYCSVLEFFFARSFIIFLPSFSFAAATTLLTFFYIARYCSFDCWSFFSCHTSYKRLFSLMTCFTSSFHHHVVF